MTKTISQQLQELTQVKSNLKTSIKNKGVEVENNTPFIEYSKLVDDIPQTKSNNQDLTITKNGEYTAEKGYTGLGTVTIDVPGIDTSTQIDTLNIDQPLRTISTKSQMQTPATFITVGSPTITSDGEVSGFSTSNYLRLPSMPNFSTADTWEIGIKFKTTQPSANQYFVCSSKSNQVLNIYFNSVLNVGHLQVDFGNSSGSAWQKTIKTISTLNANTIYYVKLEFTGSEYILSLSVDGINFETQEIYTSSSKLSYNASYNFNFGVNRDAVGNPLIGSIYIPDCYININGIRWWTGQLQSDWQDIN